MSLNRQILADAIADNLEDTLEVEIEQIDIELPEAELSEETLGAAIAQRLLEELS